MKRSRFGPMPNAVTDPPIALPPVAGQEDRVGHGKHPAIRGPKLGKAPGAVGQVAQMGFNAAVAFNGF